MVKVDTDEVLPGSVHIDVITQQGKRFPMKSSSTCKHDLNHAPVLSHLQLHHFYEIQMRQGSSRASKKDACQNTDASLLTDSSGHNWKLYLAHLLIGILVFLGFPVICKVYLDSTQLASDRPNDTGVLPGFPIKLQYSAEQPKQGTVGKSDTKTWQNREYPKIKPAYPQRITKETQSASKMNISMILESKGLGQWSNTVARALISNDAMVNIHWTSASQQCSISITSPYTNEEEIPLESYSPVQSSFGALSDFDKMGTCNMVNSVLRNYPWECRLLVFIEKFNNEINSLPFKAYRQLIQIEYDKLKKRPGMLSDLLKVFSAHIELETVITSSKAFHSPPGTAGITNFFQNINIIKIQLKCLSLRKTPKVRSHRIPLLEDYFVCRRLPKEDSAIQYTEDTDDSESEYLSFIISPRTIFGSFCSPPHFPETEISENDHSNDDAAADFTHDFTSLSMQGDSTQRPGQKTLTGGDTGNKACNSGNTFKGLSNILLAAIVWVVCAAVASSCLVKDCCMISSYILITCVYTLVMAIYQIIRSIFRVGFKLILIVTVIIACVFFTLTCRLPSRISQLKFFKKMEEVILRLSIYTSEQTHSRTVAYLTVFAMIHGYPKLSANKGTEENDEELDSLSNEQSANQNNQEGVGDVQNKDLANVKICSHQGASDIPGAGGGSLSDSDNTSHLGKEDNSFQDENKTGMSYSNSLCDSTDNQEAMLTEEERVNQINKKSSPTDDQVLSDMNIQMRDTKSKKEQSNILMESLLSKYPDVLQNNDHQDRDSMKKQNIGEPDMDGPPDNSHNSEGNRSGEMSHQSQDEDVRGSPVQSPDTDTKQWAFPDLPFDRVSEVSPGRNGIYGPKYSLKASTECAMSKTDIYGPGIYGPKYSLKASTECAMSKTGSSEIFITRSEHQTPESKNNEKLDTELEDPDMTILKEKHTSKSQGRFVIQIPNKNFQPAETNCTPSRSSVRQEQHPESDESSLDGRNSTDLQNKDSTNAGVQETNHCISQWKNNEDLSLHCLQNTVTDKLTASSTTVGSTEDRLVVDIHDQSRQRHPSRFKTFTLGSLSDMKNFLQEIESAVHGSGVFLQQFSPLNIDGGSLHYWSLPGHFGQADGHTHLYLDVRNNVLFCDQKIELRRFLNKRGSYEMAIDKQMDDSEKLQIYGITKHVLEESHYVHVIHEYRKTDTLINIFISHDAICCGRQDTCKMFTVPRGTKLKNLLLRPDVEAVKEKIFVEHPHLRENVYVKIHVAGCSWYPAPTTRLNHCCILQVVDSLTSIRA